MSVSIGRSSNRLTLFAGNCGPEQAYRNGAMSDRERTKALGDWGEKKAVALLQKGRLRQCEGYERRDVEPSVWRHLMRNAAAFVI